MEPPLVAFRFLSNEEFSALSQQEKSDYLVTAVRELAKITDLLGRTVEKYE